MQIAKELEVGPERVRYWLRRDHWETWLQYWPCGEELWADMEQERERAAQDAVNAARARAVEELKQALERQLREANGPTADTPGIELHGSVSRP